MMGPNKSILEQLREIQVEQKAKQQRTLEEHTIM